MTAGLKQISLDFPDGPDVHLELSYVEQAQQTVPYCKIHMKNSHAQIKIRLYMSMTHLLC